MTNHSFSIYLLKTHLLLYCKLNLRAQDKRYNPFILRVYSLLGVKKKKDMEIDNVGHTKFGFSFSESLLYWAV